MSTTLEHEIRFRVQNVKAILAQLISLGCHFQSEFMQLRSVYELPEGKSGWLRLRQGEQITLALKNSQDGRIEETELTLDSYEKMLQILSGLGHEPKASHENYRRRLAFHHPELADPVSIDIDTWPEIGHVVEIEGKNEADVSLAVGLLGFADAQSQSAVWDIYQEDGLPSILDRDLTFTDAEKEKWGLR